MQAVEELGADAYVYASLNDTELVKKPDIIARIDPAAVPDKGSRIKLKIRPDRIHLFAAGTGERCWRSRRLTVTQMRRTGHGAVTVGRRVSPERWPEHGVVVVEAPTLGEGWLARLADDPRAGRAFELRRAGDTRGRAAHARRSARPESTDPVIAELGDPDWLEWMHRNFFEHDVVAELGDAQSYATRLFDYGQHGTRPDRLGGRAAAPRPRVPVGGDHDVPAAHRHELHPVREPARLLARTAASSSSSSTRTASTSARRPTATWSSWPTSPEHVAGELDVPVGPLVVHAKSAHIYEPEWAAMAELAGSKPSPQTG